MCFYMEVARQDIKRVNEQQGKIEHVFLYGSGHTGVSA
jgi:hypothetical protein